MKIRSVSELGFSNEFRLMIFYLFMLMCGFAAGTRVWITAELPAISLQQYIPIEFHNIFFVLYVPAAVITLLMLFFSLFAVGWIFLPAINYLLGGAAGVLICSFFSVPVTFTNFSVLFTVSACLICTLAVVCFISLHSHKLSRQLANFNGSKCVYTYFCRNLIAASMIILLSDVIFAGIIYLQILFA